ncbi:helix-turn-helix domain-containing protein [Kribbella sp. DT2]|uniref:helix-turn-helix domain-containing protein n=1 Tax=Kribbella sp. DT2 TaxID=3393427 RepID=UPI003CF9C96A
MSVELVHRLGPAVAEYPPASTFGPRRARWYQFVWLLKGSATWLYDGARIPLVPGKLLLIRPGMQDEFHWDPRTSTRHAYVHFTLESAVPDDCPLVRDLTGRQDPMGALCNYLVWLGSTAPADWELHARETLRMLMLTFLATPATPPVALPEPVVAMLHAVRVAWSDGVARPIPLEELASAAGVSPSTLCRVFGRHFAVGPVGPVAAVELLRLARAEPLLWHTNLSIQAVAVQCGFADAYHFSRRFSAIYGLAPTAFRQAPPETAPPSPLEAAGLTSLSTTLY